MRHIAPSARLATMPSETRLLVSKASAARVAAAGWAVRWPLAAELIERRQRNRIDIGYPGHQRHAMQTARQTGASAPPPPASPRHTGRQTPARCAFPPGGAGCKAVASWPPAEPCRQCPSPVASSPPASAAPRQRLQRAQRRRSRKRGRIASRTKITRLASWITVADKMQRLGRRAPGGQSSCWWRWTTPCRQQAQRGPPTFSPSRRTATA